MDRHPDYQTLTMTYRDGHEICAASAYKLGVGAWKAGRMSVPCWDPSVCSLIEQNNGKASIILTAWAKGWHESNAKGIK